MHGRRRAGVKPPPLFLSAIYRVSVCRTTSMLGVLCQVLNVEEFTMSSTDPNQPTQSEQDHEDPAKRHPDEADEDQLDEALEETFPASDPISP